MRCCLCHADRCRFFITVEDRRYFRCDACLVTFLDPAQLPSAEFERSRYLLHRNDPGDQAYRAFLNRLAGPLLERLPPGSRGLDYGCGPGPALAEMLREAGHEVALYDPFFQPHQGVLAETYDFVTCTETAEHFHHPDEEFRRIDGLLKPGGLLGLMTIFQTDDGRFEQWHYRRDPTHVVFYRAETFLHLADRYDWDCEFPAENVAIMYKSVHRAPSSDAGISHL